MDGWIKSYRKMFDNPIVCKDSDHYAVWGYLLHFATHQPYDVVFEGKRITLKSGQLVTSRRAIAQKFSISESKVQRILKTFEIEQQIEQQTMRHNRLISLLHWKEYQIVEQQNEQQVNNNRTTSEQQVNTNNNNNNNNSNNKEYSSKENEIDKSISCTEPFTKIILKSGNYYTVTKETVEEYKKTYPNVDVEQEFRSMAKWCETNKAKRKTEAGIGRFINSWLNRSKPVSDSEFKLLI